MSSPLLVPINSVPVPAQARQADTDEQVVTLWLGCAASAHTREAYAKDVRFFLEFVGGRPLGSVKLAHIQDYRDDMMTRGLSLATINRRISSVRSLFSFAQRIGYLQFNVAAPLKSLTRRERLVERSLTPEQVEALVSALPAGKWRILGRLLYEAGLRISEALGLDGRDVIRRPDGGQVTVLGKGGKTRAVLVSYQLYAQLETLVDGPDDPLFRRDGGGRLGASRVRKVIGKACERAGLPHVSPHWLRHSHASHATDNGCPLHVLRDTLGHSSLAVTSRYIHARPNTSSSQFVVGRKVEKKEEA